MYIEINLLPREFRPKKRLLIMNIGFIGFLLIILAALGLGGYYFHLKKSMDFIDGQIHNWSQQQMKIRDVVLLQQEVEQLKKEIEERVNIIKELTGDSDIRFEMLEHINLVLPENIWLVNIDESNQGNAIEYTIEGMSYSKSNISEFLEGLGTFDKFSNVSLESIAPSPYAETDAFNYRVKVELASVEINTEEKKK